eukprot:TRINITY_DN8178_c0_g1::TRINITY_DN8178_c0_g1_i1::g.7126::m.7126 TRINITY_DN8178_c0_g1::TRINITY_DN8178_c0_g1_i1::g.7126  ORF type:complete len:795 (-),score=134.26,sp/Q9LZA6/SDP1_ARATH/32.65/7e-66,DUF3336/PF11815.3/9.2e-28,Patatin/PF01734.17/2.9e-18 TRINITY_DN8178_c0_g1_i1:112-2496(-)
MMSDPLILCIFPIYLLWTLLRIFVKLGLVLGIQISRMCLRRFRYVFFALGQYGFASLLTSRGREAIQRDAVIREKIAKATTFDEWQSLMKKRDLHEERQRWRFEEHSPEYSYKLVADTLRHLRVLRRQGDRRNLAIALNIHMVRNFAGICNPNLHNFTALGTKVAIEHYVDEVVNHINFVCDPKLPGALPVEDRMRFILESKRALGKTALCLSGGGLLALYHLGSIACLFEQGLLPQIISGASGGSIVAGMLGVITDDEIESYASTDVADRHGKKWVGPFWTNMLRLVTKGVFIDSEEFMETLIAYFGDMTFAESYQRTGRIINIAVSASHGHGHGCPPLLNYITSPQVLLRSAVAASCALTGVMKPCKLLAKDAQGNLVPWTEAFFIDGTFQNDLPMKRLSELFGVNHFIVSQTNPHIVPFLDQADPSETSLLWHLQRVLYVELVHHFTQLGRFLPFGLGTICEQFMVQQFTGCHWDITVWPEFEWKDYICILAHPDPNDIERFYLGGQRAIWPKISRIRIQYRIEKELDDWEKRLLQEVCPAGNPTMEAMASSFPKEKLRIPTSRLSFELLFVYIQRLQASGRWSETDTKDLIEDENVALIGHAHTHDPHLSPVLPVDLLEGCITTSSTPPSLPGSPESMMSGTSSQNMNFEQDDVHMLGDSSASTSSGSSSSSSITPISAKKKLSGSQASSRHSSINLNHKHTSLPASFSSSARSSTKTSHSASNSPSSSTASVNSDAGGLLAPSLTRSKSRPLDLKSPEFVYKLPSTGSGSGSLSRQKSLNLNEIARSEK